MAQVPQQQDALEDTLRALAEVRSRLHGGGLDAVAVVRAGRRELKRRSSPADGSGTALVSWFHRGSILSESEVISEHLRSASSSGNA